MNNTKLTKLLICGIIGVIASITAFAADSVVVQTFTFDSVITRHSTFHFPDTSEKIYKIIGKYRLRCSPKTAHDGFDCGEWDYHAYTYVMNRKDVSNHQLKQHPATTFGSFKIPTGGITMELGTTQMRDNWQMKNIKTTATSTNESAIALPTGTLTLKSFANHQFMITGNDLNNVGVTANTKIGKMLIEANIVDTMRNVIVRCTKNEMIMTSISAYYNTEFDTIARASYLTPEDCADGKLMIQFSKDLVWDGNSNLIFEIIADVNANSTNTFMGRKSTLNRSITGGACSYAVLADTNAWIEGTPLPNLNKSNRFTFEGWFKINSTDAENIYNASLFSIGNMLNVRLGGDAGSVNRIYISLFHNYQTNNCNTSNAALPFDQWTHIAVAYDGSGEGLNDRMKVYINGATVPMSFSGWGGVGTSFILSALDSTDASFAVGRGAYIDENTATNNLIGMVSGIRVWNAALPQEEIISNMNNTDIITESYPNYSNLLINYTCSEEYASRTLRNNDNATAPTGKVIGNIYFSNRNTGMRTASNFTNIIPNVTLVTGDFIYNTTDKDYVLERPQIPVSVVHYKNNQNLEYPTIDRIEYLYKPISTTFDINGNVIATENLLVSTNNILVGKEMLQYNNKINSQFDAFEIGRFITPYGIGLSLGSEGFEWEYDYTDYMHILRGDVTLAAHNLQELIDLKFIFYYGEPVRDVIRISEPWGRIGNHGYLQLINDERYAPIEFEFLSEAKSAKLKTRVTGHGMNGSNNVQCCEFYDNTHYLYAGPTADKVKDNQIGKWHLWRSCDDNPIFPQGGTWNLSREGWCPGDAVDEYDYEITPYMATGKSFFDYAVSNDAYTQSTATGGGYYTMAMQLVEYGPSKYKNDMELYKIINPSTEIEYRRNNPICNGVNLVVKNNTDSVMKTVSVTISAPNFEYTEQVTANIKPFASKNIEIFLPSVDDLWKNVSEMPSPEITFTVNPDGEDDNPSNNTIVQPIKLPDFYNRDSMVIRYKTNKLPGNYTFNIYDKDYNVVKTFTTNVPNNENLINLKDLPNGCYTLDFQCAVSITGGNYFGLLFGSANSGTDNIFGWAYAYQGEGAIGFYDATGKKALKTFNPNFGKKITYSFVLDNFNSIKEDENLTLSIYPNPSSDVIMLQSYENIEGATINIFDVNGQVIYNETRNIAENETISVNISTLAAGVYNVRISKDNRTKWNKFVKK